MPGASQRLLPPAWGPSPCRCVPVSPCPCVPASLCPRIPAPGPCSAVHSAWYIQSPPDGKGAFPKGMAGRCSHGAAAGSVLSGGLVPASGTQPQPQLPRLPHTLSLAPLWQSPSSRCAGPCSLCPCQPQHPGVLHPNPFSQGSGSFGAMLGMSIGSLSRMEDTGCEGQSPALPPAPHSSPHGALEQPRCIPGPARAAASPLGCAASSRWMPAPALLRPGHTRLQRSPPQGADKDQRSVGPAQGPG